MEKLRILSIGAGAIGTYVGGSLALQGHDVTFLEHPIVAEALTELKLNINNEELVVKKPHISTSLEEILQAKKFDFALFALKSFDTINALAAFKPFAKNLPPFLCLSNGVDNERRISAAMGQDKVIYGTVTTAVGKRGLGDIIVEKLRGIGVGEGHPLSYKVAAALDEAGLNCSTYKNPIDMKWSKMLTNLIANPTSAILNMTAADIFNHPQLFKLEMQQLREALAVMKAQGINIVNLPKTPVKALAFGTKLPYFLSQPLMQNAVGKGRGDKMPSFHIDLHHGRGKSEVEYLHGAVVRAGEEFNIPTPVNSLLTDILLEITNNPNQIESYRHNPAKLIAQL